MTPLTPAPTLENAGRAARAVEIACLSIAAALVIASVVRLFATGAALHWWAPAVIGAAAIAADLVSGIVHWAADTWGSQDMRVLGPRFLRPFRVHHVNPDDFLRRDPIDCNGDVAMLNIPILAAGLWMPVGSSAGAIASVALIAFAVVSLPTNQVHQWAHMERPPAAIRWLQRRKLVLTREAHALHHASPYAVNYCIATGWCNRWLTSRDLFARCERAISGVTGLRPRADEQTVARQA